MSRVVSRALVEMLAAGRGAAADFQLGSVAAAAGTGVVVVEIGGSLVTLPHLKAYVPAVNDVVLVMMQPQRQIVIGAINNPATPVAPTVAAPPASQPKPKPPAPPAVVQRTVTFTAASTGCFRGGKWRTDTEDQPHQGDYNGAYGRNTGVWFYGTAVRDALKGASILKVEMRLIRLAGGDFGNSAPSLWLHGSAKRPGGNVNLQGGAYTAAGQPVSTSRWVLLPDSFGAALAAGTSFGVACFINADTPYTVYASTRKARDSGALRITYKR